MFLAKCIALAHCELCPSLHRVDKILMQMIFARNAREMAFSFLNMLIGSPIVLSRDVSL